MTAEEQEETEAENDEDEPVDFLQSMLGAADDAADEIEDHHSTLNLNTNPTTSAYNSRKPRWWKTISGKPTKSQKRAMHATSAWRLPKVSYGEFLDWDNIFPTTSAEEQHGANNSNEIWLEIGFGNGDNLLALAEHFPERNFVGAEVHNPGIGKVCQRLQQALQTNRYWNGYELFNEESANRKSSHAEQSMESYNKESDVNKDHIDDPETNPGANSLPLEVCSPSNSTLYSNLRIHGGDGVKLLPYIPSNSLTAVLVTFPDPFPKDNSQQFRVLQMHTLQEIHRILCPGVGRLFLATDHDGHYAWCHETVERVNRGVGDANKEQDQAPLFEAVEIPNRADWLPVISKYEQKGWNEGRQTHLSCWKVYH